MDMASKKMKRDYNSTGRRADSDGRRVAHIRGLPVMDDRRACCL